LSGEAPDKTDETQPGPSYEFPIERGKIREFAQAMQSESPYYDGPDALVPPTFLTTSVRWAPAGARAAHGFERARLLHGEQEFIFHTGLPKAGQTLYASERVATRYEKEGKRGGKMRFVVLVVEFRDADGVLVAESRGTLIERAKPSAPAPDSQPSPVGEKA
jgi:hypothetical protein